MSTHMHTLTYASIYTQTHTHIYAHSYMHTPSCIYTYTYMLTYIYMEHTCTHSGFYAYTSSYTHVYTCTHIFMFLHICIFIHIYTYTHASVLPWFDLHYLQIFLQPFCKPSFLCVWKNSMWQVGCAHWFCVHFLITAQWSKCCYHNALVFQMKRKSSRKRGKDSMACMCIPSTLELGQKFCCRLRLA